MNSSENIADNVAFEPSDTQPIYFTDGAVDAVKKAISQDGQEGDGLRVAVLGEGCSGYQYGLSFEQAANGDDTVIDFSGIKVYVDAASVPLLMGTIVDFVTTEHGTGFKFNNPNAKRKCGSCGGGCG